MDQNVAQPSYVSSTVDYCFFRDGCVKCNNNNCCGSCSCSSVNQNVDNMLAHQRGEHLMFVCTHVP